FRLTAFPVRGSSGERIGRGVGVRDVTAERASERLHATFLNLVSHELRTPLGAIKGFTSALRQEDLPLDGATRRDFLDGIEAGADQLARIVAEILDLSRIEAGVLTVQREACSPRDLARAALADLAPALAAEQRVRLSIATRVPPLLADPMLARQALRGLLDNALRYSPPDGDVRLTAQQEGEQVVIRVSDRGPGLPSTELGRVFEPFYRSGRAEDGGLGLGLAICRGLVRAQGGDVWAESRPGAGTTFSIALPVAPVPLGVGGRP
ncbi:MAG: ATP-binding protein, partial [Chloroflexota bacterium]|nr:ATP-binding protein [Chloroflexota bacterium]